MRLLLFTCAALAVVTHGSPPDYRETPEAPDESPDGVEHETCAYRRIHHLTSRERSRAPPSHGPTNSLRARGRAAQRVRAHRVAWCLSCRARLSSSPAETADMGELVAAAASALDDGASSAATALDDEEDVMLLEAEAVEADDAQVGGAPRVGGDREVPTVVLPLPLHRRGDDARDVPAPTLPAPLADAPQTAIAILYGMITQCQAENAQTAAAVSAAAAEHRAHTAAAAEHRAHTDTRMMEMARALRADMAAGDKRATNRIDFLARAHRDRAAHVDRQVEACLKAAIAAHPDHEDIESLWNALPQEERARLLRSPTPELGSIQRQGTDMIPWNTAPLDEQERLLRLPTTLEGCVDHGREADAVADSPPPSPPPPTPPKPDPTADGDADAIMRQLPCLIPMASLQRSVDGRTPRILAGPSFSDALDPDDPTCDGAAATGILDTLPPLPTMPSLDGTTPSPSPSAVEPPANDAVDPAGTTPDGGAAATGARDTTDHAGADTRALNDTNEPYALPASGAAEPTVPPLPTLQASWETPSLGSVEAPSMRNRIVAGKVRAVGALALHSKPSPHVDTPRPPSGDDESSEGSDDSSEASSPQGSTPSSSTDYDAFVEGIYEPAVAGAVAGDDGENRAKFRKGDGSDTPPNVKYDEDFAATAHLMQHEEEMSIEAAKADPHTARLRNAVANPPAKNANNGDPGPSDGDLGPPSLDGDPGASGGDLGPPGGEV